VIEATVFRTISGPVPAWELLLPEELARVDALLDDPVPLEYSVAWLTCAITCRLDVIVLG